MSPDFDPIRRHIRKRLNETGAASLALAVAKDGEVIWEEGFGWADRERRQPSGPHVAYSLASISKPITATGLMTLVERGDIDLDAPANEYLGEAKLRARVGVSESGEGDFPDPVTGAREATVRRLANHTAGLPLHYQFFHEDEPWTRPAMDDSILRYGNLVTRPGERYHYANFGYGILDYIIERVSGRPYADYMREAVFHPLGLTRAAIDVPPALAPHAAARYNNNGSRIPFYTFDHPGASAAWCSAHDLVRFGLFHLKSHLPDQRAILSDASIDTMQLPTTPPYEQHAPTPARPIARSEGGVGYGLGWRIVADDNGYRTVTHSGSMGGVDTRLRLLPDENMAVAVLVNRRGGLSAEVTDDILAALLPEYNTRLQAARAHVSERPATEPFSPGEALVGPWKGRIHTYVRDLPFELTVHDDGDVHARIGDGLVALVNDVALKGDTLSGRFLGDIGTGDAAKRPYALHLDLNLRWNVLNGAVSAISLPGERMGNALSHWCELERQP